MALYVNGNNGCLSYDETYFESFGVEHIPKEVEKFIENENISTNIYRIQAYNLIKYQYVCIEFIDSKNQKLVILYKFIFSQRIWKEW